MKTMTAEQAENGMARNFCAGLLAGTGSQIEGDVLKRWVDIGVGILLSIYKEDVENQEPTVNKMSKKEKMQACFSVPYTPGTAHCVVDGVEYPFGTCEGCPYDVWRE